MRHAAGVNGDFRSDRGAIGRDARKFELHPMCALHAMVAQYVWCPINVLNYSIQLAIIEQVAHCETARGGRLREYGTGTRTGIAEEAIAPIDREELWFAVSPGSWYRVDLRVNVAVNRQQVHPSSLLKSAKAIPQPSRGKDGPFRPDSVATSVKLQSPSLRYSGFTSSEKVVL